MEKLILALMPNNKKDQNSQFFVEAENITKAIERLDELYPNKYRVIGVSGYTKGGFENEKLR